MPGPLRGVQGKGVLGLIEHGDQHGHFVEKHVEVLFEGGSTAGRSPWITSLRAVLWTTLAVVMAVMGSALGPQGC